MDALGWDSCDVIVVTGDAYVDHPSFGMAVIGRVLEAQGFRVGIIAQPDWQSADPFKVLGSPNLFFGVTAGNMDSMINRYTADRKIRSDDAYTPGDVGGKRPDRASLVYAQRCREAFNDVPIVIGGIEGSLRRIAHYDYWQDKVRRSILVDAKCDLLLYGNAERAIVEIAHRLAAREPIERITDVRGTAFMRRTDDPSAQGWFEIDSTEVDRPGRVDEHINPYQSTERAGRSAGHDLCEGRRRQPDGCRGAADPVRAQADRQAQAAAARTHRDPPAELRAGQGRPGAVRPRQPRAAPRDQSRQCARAGATAWRPRRLDQPAADPADDGRDGPRLRPAVRAQPAPRYADATGGHDGATKIPAWEMIRFSVNIMRGCFGGCTFCSITEHEGRIIQSRSEDSVIREIEEIRDTRQGLHRRHQRPRRADRQHVPHRLQEPGDRGGLPQAELRVSRHLPEPEHRPHAADPHVPARAGAARASRRS